jgi:dTDP-4-dehydrorhamnose reductase
VLVVRTSAFFGPWDEHNFVTRTLRELAAGRTVSAASDTIVSPTYVPDLVHATLDLAIDGESGIWHLANTDAITWAELARDAAEVTGHRVDHLVPVPASALGWRVPRPQYSALGSARASLMPSLRHALERYHHTRSRER